MRKSIIDNLSSLAKRGAKSDDAASQATESADEQFAGFDEMEKFYWKQNFRLMLRLEKQRRNSIWPYILKNAYRPVFLRKEKVDYLVGNPPWLSYRYIKDESYKRRIKDLTFHYGLLSKKEVKLFTQMDASTLFFVHCRQEFLKNDGTIAFVLPKSVIVPSKQHARFQRLGFSQVHDFTDVEPLFKVRTCLLVCGKTVCHDSIALQSWSGNLERRNASLAEAKKVLIASKGKFDFQIVGEPLSAYYELFINGANLYPRCPLFVEPPSDRPLNLKTPFLRTSEDALEQSKKNWQENFEGRIEGEFLFGTVLSKDLIPFVVRKLSLVVLPVIETTHHDLKLIDANTALGEGYPLANDWFLKAEEYWKERSKDKTISLQDSLNHTNKLTNQNLQARHIVLYNKSGTNLSASMLTPKETKRIHGLPIRGFITENICYRYYAKSEDEAAYLVGILNSSVVNDAIKPYQSQGLLGERDIHRRPFEVCPIPLFNGKNPLHLKIAEVARKCREELLPIVPKMQTPVATARADARHLVQGKLNKLDELVRKLLGNPTRKTLYPPPDSEPLKLMELF